MQLITPPSAVFRYNTCPRQECSTGYRLLAWLSESGNTGIYQTM